MSRAQYDGLPLWPYAVSARRVFCYKCTVDAAPAATRSQPAGTRPARALLLLPETVPRPAPIDVPLRIPLLEPDAPLGPGQDRYRAQGRKKGGRGYNGNKGLTSEDNVAAARRRMRFFP